MDKKDIIEKIKALPKEIKPNTNMIVVSLSKVLEIIEALSLPIESEVTKPEFVIEPFVAVSNDELLERANEEVVLAMQEVSYNIVDVNQCEDIVVDLEDAIKVAIRFSQLSKEEDYNKLWDLILWYDKNSDVRPTKEYPTVKGNYFEGNKDKWIEENL